jgi:gas vesicle protein
MRGRSRRRAPEGLHAGMVLLGLVIGGAAGAIFGLLKAPRSGAATRQYLTYGITQTGESIREKIDDVVTADPVGESIAEGKAAAQRRRAQLGLTTGTEPPPAPSTRVP